MASTIHLAAAAPMLTFVECSDSELECAHTKSSSGGDVENIALDEGQDAKT